MDVCPDCSGSRAVPGLLRDYDPCPTCVIDAGETFVVMDWQNDDPSDT